jgi:hypothetical protein
LNGVAKSLEEERNDEFIEEENENYAIESS